MAHGGAALASLSRLWAVQIIAHSASDLVEAAQQELAEASGMLDLTEHGLDHLLSRR